MDGVYGEYQFCHPSWSYFIRVCRWLVEVEFEESLA
jgi:hypothetical protein